MFSNIENCKKNKLFKKNKKYPHLNLPFKIAGDDKQLQELIIMPREKLNSLRKNNIKVDKISSFYKQLIKEQLNIPFYNDDPNAFFNTLNYMFYKIGMGIYIKIQDNQLKLFVPFANMNFKNNWKEYITYEDDINNIKEFQKVHNLKQFIHFDESKWSTNNCLIGHLKSKPSGSPISSSRMVEIRIMLEDLCRTRKIKDVEFFINKRDFPVIKKDLTEPYYHIFNNKKKNFKKYKYDSYLPILSPSGSPEYADILLPNEDDILLKYQDKVFINNCFNKFQHFNDIKIPKWDDKIPIALFRGSATGCGITIRTNQRLNLANKSKNIKDLDAGITSWNIREKKRINGKLNILIPDNLNIKLSNKLSFEEQMKYKYLINVDGHVSAFRMSWLLKSKSVILQIESKDNYKLWFSDLLKPWIHYVPIKSNLSDIKEKIKWCKENDLKCKQIAKNAFQLANKLNIKDYMQNLLNSFQL